MNRYYRGIEFFFKSDVEKKYKIIQIIFLIVKSYLLVTLLPLKFYQNRISLLKIEHQIDIHAYEMDIILINKVISTTPWIVTCLMRSLVVQSYFKQFNIHIPIYLGLKKGLSGKLYAHAWTPIFISESIDFKRINFYTNE